MSNKTLTAQQTIARLKRGEKLYLSGFGGSGRFEGGAVVRVLTIQALIDAGRLRRPAHTSIYSPFDYIPASAA